MVSWFLGGGLALCDESLDSNVYIVYGVLSVASPTRLHAFKLNMHHISGNFDLPTFPFISSVPGNNSATFRRLPVVGLSLVCVLCSKLASEWFFYLHVCDMAGWLRWVHTALLLWSPLVPPWRASHPDPLVSSSEWWWAVTPCCERKVVTLTVHLLLAQACMESGDCV